MKNLKMFAIGLVAFAAMTMGVHAATADAVYTDKNGLEHHIDSTNDTFAKLIEAADAYSLTEEIPVEVTIKEADLTDSTTTTDIEINGNVVLNLGDYKLILDNSARFVVKGGTLTIKGTDGKAAIENTTNATSTLIKLEGEDSHLKIEKGVTIYNKDNTNNIGAIILFADANGSAKNSSIEISGIIKSDGGNAVATRGEIKKAGDKVAPTVKINDGAIIECKNAAGYYQAGYAIGTINNATIEGNTGVSVKAGTLTLNNPTVTGTGANKACDASATVGSTQLTGAAVQIEGNNSYASPAKVTFNGGNYTSEEGNAVKACAYTVAAIGKDSKINGGEFTSGDDEEGEPLPNIALSFSSNDEDTLSWIDDLEGFVTKGTFNGPVVGDVTVGTLKMAANTMLTKLTNGATVNTDNGGNSTVNGGSTPSTPSDENKPNTGDDANTPSDSKNPQTGDSIMTYMGLGIASIAVVGLGAKNLKKQTSR